MLKKITIIFLSLLLVACSTKTTTTSTTISKDKDFPIMSLVIDEMTGEAGYITRIEAFVDLLERRERKCII